MIELTHKLRYQECIGYAARIDAIIRQIQSLDEIEDVYLDDEDYESLISDTVEPLRIASKKLRDQARSYTIRR